MSATVEARGSRLAGFGAGTLLAVVGTGLWFVLMLASSLTNDDFFFCLLAGTGLLLLVGVGLALTKPYRWAGFGLLIGAPVMFLIEWGVLILLITSVTY